MPTNTDLEYRQATATENVDSAQGNWPNIEHGQDTVAVAGTAEALNGGTSLSVPDGASVAVVALNTNTGNVYVGDASVTASNGAVLTPDSSISVSIEDVSSIFIDVDNAGEGVSWIVEAN